MLDTNKIILLLVLGHCLTKGTLAIILLIRLYRIEAKNRIYHRANKEDKAQ